MESLFNRSLSSTYNIFKAISSTIQDELRRNGSPKAMIETDDTRSYFLIRIPCHPDFIEVGQINGQINYPLEERQRVVLELIYVHTPSSYTELASLAGMSERTIRREVRILVALGLVRKEGSNKKGRWVATHPKSQGKDE